MSAGNASRLALIARDRLGRGQHVEVALFDIALAMTGFYGMAYLMNGVNPSRQGNSPNGSPSVGVYNASDAPFYIACANDRLYRRLRSEEHTSELQSLRHLVCRLLLEKKKTKIMS